VNSILILLVQHVVMQLKRNQECHFFNVKWRSTTITNNNLIGPIPELFNNRRFSTLFLRPILLPSRHTCTWTLICTHLQSEAHKLKLESRAVKRKRKAGGMGQQMLKGTALGRNSSWTTCITKIVSTFQITSPNSTQQNKGIFCHSKIVIFKTIIFSTC
jgi:hypothetical protein